MANLADHIEQFILRQLAAVGADNIVVLQRNELADVLACAPSQISYVINTRFTSERGFVVESRRGSGGFIRIARLPGAAYWPTELETPALSERELEAVIKHWRDNNLLTMREATLIVTMFRLLRQRLDDQERVYVLQELVDALTNS